MEQTALPYPWLREPWNQLAARLQAGRLPHALLLHGPAGIGKMALAECFAARLLCRDAGDFACGHCSSCRLFSAGTHPDYIKVEPPEPGKAIGVDAVRSLIATLALHPQFDGWRVVICAPAHQLNMNAANALLKTLEEPAPRTLMLLLTDSPSGLPATILSRCQRQHAAPPEFASALGWLREAGVTDNPGVLLAAARGSPLVAFALDKTGVAEQRESIFTDFIDVLMGRRDPVQAAELWLAGSHERYLEWIQTWIADLIRMTSASGVEPLYNPDLYSRMQALAGRLQLTQLFEAWAALLQAKRGLGGPFNRQLLLEEFLIICSRLGRRRHSTELRHEQ